MKRLRLIPLFILFLAALAGCSLKKNTPLTRQYSAFITRYNIYFNGDQHYKETLKEMESKYQDDYTRLVLMHPAEAYADEKAPQPTGDFNRSIEKAQKAIQLRSIKKKPKKKSGKSHDPKYKAWMKREEYNPFLHNAWMMQGRSQYLNGDYLGAASTFYYIAKHFSWLPNTVTEAKLWQAKAYLASDWLFEAESLVSKIPEKDLTNSTLKGLYYFVYADFYVRSHDYAKAIPMLVEAIKYADGPQRTRLTFLLGQLYEAEGNKAAAYKAFAKAGGASNASYRTKFNARIKQSEVFEGEDIAPEVKALRNMTRYDRNKEYLDQIYYAIGNLYLSRRDTTAAVENYKKAVEQSTRNGIEKAIVQVALGGLYYDFHKYNLAQPCYSEAVPMLPDDYPDLKLLKHRSDVLDELSVYAQNVELQDSLLKLSNMTPEQQRDVIDKIIEALKKKEKEEAEAARREEYLANQQAQGTGLQNNNANTPNQFVLNTDNSWYFYNQATKQQGRTEFQKRWGSRKLEDDWRRRNKASFSFDEFETNYDDVDTDNPAPADSTMTDEEAAKAKETLDHESDPHFPEYYLKDIPKTDAERTQANDIIQEGLYNMGLILKDNMRDYPSAEEEFLQLNSRYPDNVYRLDAYYNLYLMYVLTGRTADAEHYRQLILSDFPDSKYGEAMRDPHYMDKLREMVHVQQTLYDRIYEAYLNNDNALVHSIYQQVRKDYPMSRIMPKFMFIEALSYVSERDSEKFSATLRELLERYPETDVSPLASDYLKNITLGKQLSASSGNLRGMVWSTRLSNDTTDGANSMLDAAKFTFSTTSPQDFILLYPADVVDGKQLLFDVARHNFTSYMVRDFDLEQMRFGNLGLIVVKGFANRAELEHYRASLTDDASFRLPEQVIPVMISDDDFQLLLSQGRSFEEYFDAVGDDRLRKVHEAVLPPNEYPSAEEMYAPWQEQGPMDLPEELPQDAQPQDDDLNPDAPASPVPTDKPVTDKPAGKPASKPAPGSKPATVPKPAPAPKPTPKPAEPLPEYPEGSEGDDPLLE